MIYHPPLIAYLGYTHDFMAHGLGQTLEDFLASMLRMSFIF